MPFRLRINRSSIFDTFANAFGRSFASINTILNISCSAPKIFVLKLINKAMFIGFTKMHMHYGCIIA